MLLILLIISICSASNIDGNEIYCESYKFSVQAKVSGSICGDSDCILLVDNGGEFNPSTLQTLLSLNLSNYKAVVMYEKDCCLFSTMFMDIHVPVPLFFVESLSKDASYAEFDCGEESRAHLSAGAFNFIKGISMGFAILYTGLILASVTTVSERFWQPTRWPSCLASKSQTLTIFAIISLLNLYYRLMITMIDPYYTTGDLPYWVSANFIYFIVIFSELEMVAVLMKYDELRGETDPHKSIKRSLGVSVMVLILVQFTSLIGLIDPAALVWSAVITEAISFITFGMCVFLIFVSRRSISEIVLYTILSMHWLLMIYVVDFTVLFTSNSSVGFGIRLTIINVIFPITSLAILYCHSIPNRSC